HSLFSSIKLRFSSRRCSVARAREQESAKIQKYRGLLVLGGLFPRKISICFHGPEKSLDDVAQDSLGGYVSGGLEGDDQKGDEVNNRNGTIELNNSREDSH